IAQHAPDRSRLRYWLLLGGLIAVAAGGAVAALPWAALGAAVGAVLLLVVLVQPLALIGVMLAIGPIDLSFLTGGFKALLTEQGGVDMNGIRLIGMTIGLTALVLVDREVLRSAFGRYGRWYLVFLLWAAGTLVLSTELLDGLRLLLKLAFPFLIFVAVLGCARSRADLERLSDWALVGAAVIALVLNPIYVMAGGYEINADGRIRIQGVGVHENPFSFYLLAVLLLAFARFAVRGDKRQLLLCGVLGVWMVLTLTRITLLASLVGLAGIAVYGALLTRNYRALAGAVVVGGAVAIALLPVALERTLGYMPTPSQLLAMLRDPVQLYRAMNWQGRELLWPVILGAMLSSPFTGLGLGSTGTILRANFPEEMGLVVHNEYLRLAAETGIVGAVLFLIAIMTWLSGVVRVGRLHDRAVREFALPAIGGILAWAVIAITDNAFDYYAQFTQYIAFFCAAALAAARSAGAEGEVVAG
ncbi:MAG: O-antigen ligase family protein, partial [Longimicrobiales bacterium]